MAQPVSVVTLFEGRRAISEISELAAEAIVQLLTRGSHRSVADGVADRDDGGHPSRLVLAKLSLEDLLNE